MTAHLYNYINVMTYLISEKSKNPSTSRYVLGVVGISNHMLVKS